ncbi:MAG: hypothetical protein PVI37_12040, partial [Gammaproteobacteria bacterium]
MVQVRKIDGSWSAFVPEYQSEDELVFSKAGRLYWCEKRGNEFFVTRSYRICSILQSFVARASLLARLFRLQFYNVIRCNGGWFITWGKKIFFVDSNGGKHEINLAGRSFRVFR